MAITASTAQSIINRARYVLKDQVEGALRWTDTEVCLFIQDGQREIIRRRPELYLTSDGAQSDTALIPDPGAVEVGTTLHLHPSFDGAILDYVLARCFAKDAGDNDNKARSQYHLEQFELRMKQR